MPVTRQMIFPLAFYKKSKFNGSKGKLNYRIEKVSGDEKDEFLLTVWKGPFCYDATKEEKTTYRYPFSDEGLDAIVEQLNQLPTAQ